MGFLVPLLGGAASGIFGGLLTKLFERRDSGKGSFLTKPEQLKEFERFTPEQTDLLKSIQSILTGKGQQPSGGILGQLFSPEGFEAYAAPARREFFESTVPGIAERFSSLGSGAQRSSAFQQQLAKAGEDLSTSLGELRSQQQKSLLGPLLGQIMQPRVDRIYQPPSPTGVSQFLSGLTGGIGQGIPLLLSLLARR